MRYACFASTLQHGLNMPHIHALATASIQKHDLSRHNAHDVAHAGRVIAEHEAVLCSPTLYAMQSASVLQHGLDCSVHSSP